MMTSQKDPQALGEFLHEQGFHTRGEHWCAAPTCVQAALPLPIAAIIASLQAKPMFQTLECIKGRNVATSSVRG
jgi:hypothetical protein